jgi:transposase
MGRAEIKRLRKKGLSYNEIAEKVGLHRNTVARLIKEPKDKTYQREQRTDAATPYTDKIKLWIKKEVPTERMLELVRTDEQAPYKKGRSAFFAGVARLRGLFEEAASERFTRFEGLPGEYAQVDWGEIRDFPFKQQAPATRYYLAIRLKFSRVAFVMWTDSMVLEVLLRAHLVAFEAFGGVPWVLVYDNMKTVTIGRDEHNQPIWNPVFEKFSQELDFKPEACDKGCPNQKGSVENLVGWVQSSFLQERTFNDDQDLARQTEDWLRFGNEERPNRAHGEIPQSLLPEEQLAFTPLSETAEEYGLFSLVTPNREGRVSVEGTKHQVPIGYAQTPLVLRRRRSRLDFYDGDRLVASYPRPTGVARYRAVFEPEHLEPLLLERPRARVMVYRDYLVQQHSTIATYVAGLCSRHRGNERFGPHILRMFGLLRAHGTGSVAAACALAAEEKAYGVEYLEGLLLTPVRPASIPSLDVPGAPTQAMVDRDLGVYEAYAVGGLHA